MPLTSRSAASTPSTGSPNVTVTWVRLLTNPGAGVNELTTGGVDMITNTRDTLEVAAAP